MRAQVKRKVKRAILQSLERGASISQACAAAGVSRRAFYDWLHTDPDFSAAVDLSLTKQIALAESVLFRAIEAGDLKAAMWWLERRVPEYRPPSMQPKPIEPAPQIELQVLAPEREVGIDELIDHVLCEREPAQSSQVG